MRNGNVFRWLGICIFNFCVQVNHWANLIIGSWWYSWNKHIIKWGANIHTEWKDSIIRRQRPSYKKTNNQTFARTDGSDNHMVKICMEETKNFNNCIFHFSFSLRQYIHSRLSTGLVILNRVLFITTIGSKGDGIYIGLSYYSSQQSSGAPRCVYQSPFDSLTNHW